MPLAVRISLATKCQLLFGAAVVLILTAALAVAWERMQKLMYVGLQETSHKLAEAYLSNLIQVDRAEWSSDAATADDWADQGIHLAMIYKHQFLSAASRDPFLAEAIERFKTHGDRNTFHRPVNAGRKQRYYRFARAIRHADLKRLDAASESSPGTSVQVHELEQVLLIQIGAEPIQRLQLVNRIYIVAAGLLAGLLAIGVFWYITRRVILSPIGVLRDTAEKVTQGDPNIRADINTGDEYEQLGQTFNQMLETIVTHQDNLRRMNKTLDLKLGELAEHNVALYEADKLKDEFLANVSHELRTPLNSIVGFAEVLQETLQNRTGPVDEKRKRYIGNIINSSRQLLELINDLLDLSKIEAGRMELQVSPVSLADTAEGLITLIRPQAEKRRIDVAMKIDSTLPLVQTDERKVQQILFNFLSNAVKFTPEGGSVVVSAEPVSDSQVRISVRDTGPGIRPQDHEKIFEKFKQLESTETRLHSGTGLGLTISRDLARLLQGQIELDSDVAQGATFSLLLPLAPAPQSVPLMPETPAAAASGAT